MASKTSRLAIILGLNSAGYNAGLTKAAARFKKFGASMQSAGRNLTRSVGAPLALLAGAAGKAAVDFEFSMAKVAAVAGASSEDMNKLEASAKLLGKTTAFSASEVAGLQLELSKLGFAKNVEELLDMEEGILSVAQAFDKDLGETAASVGQTLRQFNIPASQAAKVTDVMAVAFGQTALDLENFSSGMANVGPIAADAGLSLEETTTLLGILANNGIAGADAGTKLKMALTNIRAAGLDVGDTLKEITAGSFDFDESLGLLGKRAQIVAPILGGAGKDIVELNEALVNSDGAAGKARKTLDDTAQGAIFRMKSAVEGLAISFGELLLPKIERTANFVGALAAKFESLDGATKETILNVISFATAMGPALFIGGKLVALIGNLLKVVGVLAGPWGLVAAAVAGAIYLIYTNWDSLVTFFTQGAGTGFLDAVVDAFNAFATLVVGIVEFVVAGALAFWDQFGADITRLAIESLEGVTAMFQRAFEGVARLFGTFSALFAGDWEGFFRGIVDTALTILQFLVERFVLVFGTIGGLLDSLLDALGFDTNIEGGIEELGGALVDGLEDLKFEKAAAAGADDYFTGFSNTLGGLFSGGFNLPGLGLAPSGQPSQSAGGGNGETGVAVAGVGLTGGVVEETIEQVDQLALTFDKMKEAGRGALDSIGQAFADAITGAQSFGDALKQVALQLINQLIQIGTGYLITSMLSPFSVDNQVTGGTAGLVKAATASGTVSTLLSGLTAFAEGGAVLGPTLSLLGEKPGSRGEFVVPFEKVGQFLNMAQGSDNASTIVNGRIRGNDIHLTNFESDRVLSRRRVI
jgi:hypothetical protein